MDPVVFATPADLSAGITIPAHHTVEYSDADGNVIAHFNVTRPHHLRAKLDHWLDHGYSFPITASFTEHEPPAPTEAMVGDEIVSAL